MSFSLARAIASAALLVTLSAGAARAHEGHDHADQPKLAPADVAPRGEAASQAFELVAVAQGAELLIYLDRFADNAPVKDAVIEVETPDGAAKATAAGDTYRLAAPWLGKAGRVDLIFTVTADGAVDVLPLSLNVAERGAQAGAPGSGSMTFGGRIAALIPSPWIAMLLGFGAGAAAVALLRRRQNVATLLLAFTLASAFAGGEAHAHEGEDHSKDARAQALGGERAQRQADGAIFVPKAVQRIFAIRTALIDNAAHRRASELPGRVIPDPNASGFVQAAVGGRLSPPPNGFPRLGTKVQKGDVLAYVTPPLQAIDISDMRQRQGELDQQISIVERRLARYETLVPVGAISRTQLEETRLELEGLKIRRASLDNVRREPEALVAPVAGVVAEGTPVAGQIAQSNAVIFHIVDPSKLWVEALSFDAISEPEAASAQTANGKTLSLAFRGSGFADRSQSIPVHFSIEGDVSGLRAGQFVTVLVTTGEQKQGLAVARGALVRSANGQDFVYEHVAAERFEPRPVRVEPLDGDRVLIAAGIEPGRRIVVQGAELLDHVR